MDTTTTIEIFVIKKNMVQQLKGDYEEFFQAAMKKFGISSDELKSDEAKKKFFNYVDKNYKAKGKLK